MKKLIIALALAAVPLACNTEAGDPEAEAPEDVLMHDTLSDAAVAPGDTAGGLTVMLSEWTIRTARDTVDAGPADFRVRNNGEYGHILEVEGQGNEWATDTIPPGEWVTLQTDLASGTYELYCPIQGEQATHQELGMSTPLVVVDRQNP